MSLLKKLVGAYLVGVAVAVAVWFIVSSFPNDAGFDVMNVWRVLNVLMVIALPLSLVFNYCRKREEGGRDPGGAITRRYLEVNAAFYLTAAITILFLHNWFSLLAFGESSLDGNHQAWVIWAVVDTLLPITLGVTGCAMWRDAAEE